jgi:two-component system, cell cycle sensor histidine kinase and response regulator CckA
MEEISVPGRARHRRSDGTEIEVQVISHPVTFGERAAQFVLAEDVGERERLADQLRQAQRMEAIGRLAGGIAHDFNNLLTAVIGYGNLMLAKTAADDPRRTDAEEIKKAGERAVALTRQLLTLGRRQALEPVVLDVNEVVGALIPMLRRLIRATVKIETEFAAGAARIRADRGQVEQVLVNLAVNASDAMPDGGRLAITTGDTYLDEDYFRLHPAGQGEPGPYLILEVTDSGIGMDEETISHVFEPFFTTKSADRGTGLGLATVYGIVRQSGGFVWAYSEVGRGTTFKVYLPVVDAPVEPPHERDHAGLLTARGRTVLLVEDDAPVRAVVRRMLEAHGFTILEAGAGDEALALSDAEDPGSLDLLVADTVIPGPGGTVLAGRIRGRHPELRTLVMSGYSETIATGDVPLEPGTEFIAKPFSPADLNAKLTTLLGDDAG